MQDKVRYTTIDTPIGVLLLTGDDAGLSGVYMESHKRGPRIGRDWKRDERAFSKVAEQFSAYFAGKLRRFDVPLSLDGTPFQKRVWRALCAVPFGETRTYTQVARRVGLPQAVRAVGAAVGRNPISIIVPCHRIVGSDGGLRGFAGGLPRKRWLLEHEGVIVNAPKRRQGTRQTALSSR